MYTYYLVDFENVGNEGMNGCESLTENDRIYLFYTKNVKSINMNIIGGHGGAKLSVLEVPVRKQSIDMHLVSFLGYFIGRNNGSNIKYVIISKDTDYDNIIKFWKDKKKISISRAEKIKNEKKPDVKGQRDDNEKKVNTQNQNTVTANSDMSSKKSEGKSDQPKKSKKTQLNDEMQRELKQAKVPPNIMGYITSNVLKHIGEKNNKNTVYQMLTAKYGQTQGLELYKKVKKFL